MYFGSNDVNLSSSFDEFKDFDSLFNVSDDELENLFEIIL